MNKQTIQAAALILAMSATAAMASAQTTPATSGAAGAGGGSMPSTTTHSGSAMMSASPKPKAKTTKKNLARHGPPIDAAGANGGGTSHPESGSDVPSTSGMSSSNGSGK